VTVAEPARSAGWDASPEPRFRVDIAGLRAVAVGLVVLYHAGVPWLPGGYVGVDVFFVISGFLITGQLLRRVGGGGLDLAAFYGRRVRRLVPAALLVVVCTLVVSVVVLSPLRAEAMARDAAASALYVPNVWFALSRTNYLTEPVPSPFQQFWSLGLEEQFYLVWPLVLLVAWRVTRGSLRAAGVALAVVGARSFALSLVLTPVYGPWAFLTLPTRAWEFAAGGLLAIWSARGARAPGILAWVGLVVIAVAGVRYDDSVQYPGYAAALPVLGSVLVVGSGGATRLLGARPLQDLGRISYSLYLWHWPVLIGAPTLVPTMPLWGRLALAVACVPLAALTYRYVEDPARRRRFPPGRTILASFLVAAVALGAAAAFGHRPLTSGRTAPPYTLDQPVRFTGFVPANGTPGLRQAAADLPVPSAGGCSPGPFDAVVRVCAYGDPTARRTYVLFGDSHAAQWYSAALALADRDGARLVVVFKAGCTSVDVPRYDGATLDAFCETWRRDATAQVAALHPDLTIVGNLHVRTDGAGERVGADRWVAATTRSLAALPDPRKVVVLADTPWFESSVPACAARHLEDVTVCARPRGEVLDGEWVARERAAVEGLGARYVDLSEVYCADVCGPYLGNLLLYRDGNHLTDTFVRTLAPRFVDAVG
jgi:peptidoglycan/LPS O-acetylase OafA/YrhL